MIGCESRLAATVCSPPGIIENKCVTSDTEYRNLHPVVAELPAHEKLIPIEPPSRADGGTVGIVGTDDKPAEGVVGSE